MIGKVVKVIVDRPLGSAHPNHSDLIYSVNYGYIPTTFAPDGEEQDAYILGVNEPVAEFVGKVIAIILLRTRNAVIYVYKRNASLWLGFLFT